MRRDRVAFETIMKHVHAFMQGHRSALQTGGDLRCVLDHPCWLALGGGDGPLAALFGADDEADRHHFLGANVEMWHPNVIDTKRAALLEAEARWHAPVRGACEALLRYGAER